MKTWETFGAMGDTIVELGGWDILKLLVGREVEISGAILCFGKSKRSPEGERAKIDAQIRRFKAAGL